MDFGSGFNSLILADVNGDGILDLVNDTVEVALGKGNGKFEKPVYWPVNGGGIAEGGLGAGVGDLRGDGRTDIITEGGPVSILLNTGKGAFEDGIKTTVPGGALGCAAAADFNGDGVPDLVVVNSNGLQILIGTGKASEPFSVGASYTVSSPDGPAVGDLNGDGIPDILAPSGSYYAAGSVIAYLGNGDGSFGTANPFVPYIEASTMQTGFTFIGVADLEGPGRRPDLVLIDGLHQLIYVLSNRDGQSWKERVTNVNQAFLELGVGVFGDVNGDGKPDLVTATDGGLYVFLNDGSGNLNYSYKLPYVTNSTIPLIADVNGDGIADLISLGGGDAAVYLGEGANAFAAPVYLGTANNPVGGFALDLHGQNPKQGTRDLVEIDGSGVIYTLINQTR